MPLAIKNLSILHNRDPFLGEALKSIQDALNQGFTQTGVDATGEIPPPPTISALNVSAANGLFSISIVDNGAIYKSIEYFVDWSLNANFAPARTIEMGSTRTLDIFLGNVTAYFRAYSSYPGSQASQGVYFAANPVTGGGVAAPAPTPSTGAGTASGTGNQSGTGSGPTPFRPAPSSPGQSPRLGPRQIVPL